MDKTLISNHASNLITQRAEEELGDVKCIAYINVLQASRLKLLKQNLATPLGGVFVTFLCGNTLSNFTARLLYAQGASLGPLLFLFCGEVMCLIL
jgi:hypothetical protein